MKKTLFKLSAVATLVLFFVALSAVANMETIAGAFPPVALFSLSAVVACRLSPWR